MATNEHSRVIPNVERLRWQDAKINTFINSLTVALNAMGEKAAYDELMGFSGAAFRLHFFQPQWCRSSPDATCGFDHSGPAAAAVGFAMEFVVSKADDAEAVARVRQRIVESINTGRPVLAGDLMGVLDWGVIVGYEDDGNTLLCRDYNAESEDTVPARKFPWLVAILGEKGEIPSRRENILKSLSIAAELADTPNYGPYTSGFAAYRAWSADLRDAAGFESADADQLRDLWHTNDWCYQSLLDARRSAARYLNSVAEEFDDETADSLRQAAELYERVLRTLRDGAKNVPFHMNEKPWIQEMRNAQADILNAALEMEREAVGCLCAARHRL